MSVRRGWTASAITRAQQTFRFSRAARDPASWIDGWLHGMRSEHGGTRRSFAHFYTAYEAALAGEGLLIVPTLLAADDVQRGRLVAFKPGVRLQGARHMLLWRKADEASQALVALAAWLRQETAPGIFPSVQRD